MGRLCSVSGLITLFYLSPKSIRSLGLGIEVDGAVAVAVATSCVPAASGEKDSFLETY